MNGYAWFKKPDGREVYRRIEPTQRDNRSSLACPMIVSDSMAAAEHPVTGQMIDSKSRFERITKDAGYITVGDDPARLRPAPKPKPDKQAIRKSIEKAKARLSA